MFTTSIFYLLYIQKYQSTPSMYVYLVIFCSTSYFVRVPKYPPGLTHGLLLPPSIHSEGPPPPQTGYFLPLITVHHPYKVRRPRFTNRE